MIRRRTALGPNRLCNSIRRKCVPVGGATLLGDLLRCLMGSGKEHRRRRESNMLRSGQWTHMVWATWEDSRRMSGPVIDDTASQVRAFDDNRTPPR